MTEIEESDPFAPVRPAHLWSAHHEAGLDPERRAWLDNAVTELAEGANGWSTTPLAERAGLLAAVHAAMIGTAERWATTASDIKGLAADSPLVGEEWISGPYATMAGVGALANTVASLAGGVSPLAKTRFGVGPGGRLTVPVLPANALEWVLMHGFSAEVWMKPTRTAADVRASAGLGELTPEVPAGVGLVLGAGNITSIAPLDVLYELVARNRSVLLKLNPTLDRMLPIYQEALAPLIEFGALRIVQGDGDVGRYLSHHPGISHVHITGSAATHDVVVYGAGAVHDHVVGGGAARDVHVRDARMMGEVSADVTVSLNDAQRPELDERCERLLVDRQHPVQRWVELEEHGTVPGDQLIKHVERGNRGDVSRAEHQAHPRGYLRGELTQPGARTHVRRGPSRLHPYLGAETVHEHPLERIRRQDGDGEAPSRPDAEPGLRQRAHAACQTRDGVRQGANPRHGRVRARDPLLAHQWRVRGKSLNVAGRRGPALGGPDHRSMHGGEQACSLSQRGR